METNTTRTSSTGKPKIMKPYALTSVFDYFVPLTTVTSQSIAKGECLMDMIEDETESQSIYTGGWAQVHASGWGDYDGPEYSLAWPQFWSATGWNKGDFRTYSVSVRVIRLSCHIPFNVDRTGR